MPRPTAGQHEALDAVASALVELTRVMKDLHEEALSRAGLDTRGGRLELAAIGLLSCLERCGAGRVSALAEQTRQELSTVSRQVAALERAGLLDRRRDPDDSRASLLTLTAAGAETLRAVRRARSTLLAERLPGWDDGELALLRQRLDRFTQDLRGSAAERLAGAGA